MRGANVEDEVKFLIKLVERGLRRRPFVGLRREVDVHRMRAVEGDAASGVPSTSPDKDGDRER